MSAMSSCDQTERELRECDTWSMKLEQTVMAHGIANYEGPAGVYYSHNDCARVKVLYSVFKNGMAVCDEETLRMFHKLTNGRLLFASGMAVEDKTVLCANKSKAKSKTEEKNPGILKNVFEEVYNEVDISNGIISGSYRVNLLSRHDMLKEINKFESDFKIEISSPLSSRVVITESWSSRSKYHRPKAENAKKKAKDSSVLVPSPPTIPQGEQLPRTPQSRVKSTRDHTISATKEINKPVILPKKSLSDTKNVSDILCFPQSILGKHIFEDFGDDDGNNELDELLEIRSMFDYADLALSESCSPPMNLDFLTSASLGFDGSGPFAPLTDNKL